MKAILLIVALLVAVIAATPVVTAHVACACEVSDPSCNPNLASAPVSHAGDAGDPGCGPYLPPTPENPLGILDLNRLPLTVMSTTALLVGLN